MQYEPLPTKPQDPSSLQALLDWCRQTAASLGFPSPQRDALAWNVQSWYDQAFGGAHVGVPCPPAQSWHPADRTPDEEYSTALAHYLVQVGASAAAVEKVHGADSASWHERPDDPASYADRAYGLVLFEPEFNSLDRRAGFFSDRPDTADLWRWSAAGKGDGPASAKTAQRALFGALDTGRNLHGLLAAALQRANPPAATPTRPRLHAVRLS